MHNKKTHTIQIILAITALLAMVVIIMSSMQRRHSFGSFSVKNQLCTDLNLFQFYLQSMEKNLLMTLIEPDDSLSQELARQASEDAENMKDIFYYNLSHVEQISALYETVSDDLDTLSVTGTTFLRAATAEHADREALNLLFSEELRFVLDTLNTDTKAFCDEIYSPEFVTRYLQSEPGYVEELRIDLERLKKDIAYIMFTEEATAHRNAVELASTDYAYLSETIYALEQATGSGNDIATLVTHLYDECIGLNESSVEFSRLVAGGAQRDKLYAYFKLEMSEHLASMTDTITAMYEMTH